MNVHYTLLSVWYANVKNKSGEAASRDQKVILCLIALAQCSLREAFLNVCNPVCQFSGTTNTNVNILQLQDACCQPERKLISRETHVKNAQELNS